MLPCDLPGIKPRSRKSFAFNPDGMGLFSTLRTKSGMVRVNLMAKNVAAKDMRFQQFLSGLVADVKLSLVMGETA